ncbi:MAG: HD domain-containing protein [Bacteroidia bacterium]|nr:HD domain-containing protein [Bacteroidia bacterium]
MNYSAALNDPVFHAIGKAADEAGVRAYIVGGWVRDLLLNKESKDIDIVCIGNGIELAEAFARKSGGITVSVFKNFGTAQVKINDLDIEFVGARKESYRRDSRNPVVENGTLEEDQNRRDFTVNAMSICLNAASFGEFLDPFNGRKDLAEKVLRTPLDPDITYSDDPLRMMRAVRFSCQLGFQIEEASLLAIGKNAGRIGIVSMERITEELNRIILSPAPGEGFRTLNESGLLPVIFPEFCKLKGVETVDDKSHKDNFYHTLEVLDNVSRVSTDLWLRWAAILHDIAKPQTKRYDKENGWTFHGHEDKGARMVPRIFARLKLPQNEKMKFVQKLVLLHLRPIALSKEEVTDSAVRRLLFEAGDAIDDLMLLCNADITSKNPNRVARYMRNFNLVREKLKEVEEKDRIRNWQPPVSGELIMKTFGIPAGKQVGIIKDAIREAILDGVIPNTYETAFGFMLQKGKELGLAPAQ